MIIGLHNMTDAELIRHALRAGKPLISELVNRWENTSQTLDGIKGRLDDIEREAREVKEELYND